MNFLNFIYNFKIKNSFSKYIFRIIRFLLNNFILKNIFIFNNYCLFKNYFENKKFYNKNKLQKKYIKIFRVGLTAEKDYTLVGRIGLTRARVWLARFRDLI